MVVSIGELIHQNRAGIPFGLTVESGVIWHDLRRTFATELRGRQVHEYDIGDLLGQTFYQAFPLSAKSLVLNETQRN